MSICQETEPGELLVSRLQGMNQVRRRVEAGDETLRQALSALRAEADGALRVGPFSVVNDSTVPPSGDKHDYLSVGPYWWPDPAQADGLPYIRRDGEVNPERKAGDSVAMGRMNGAVKALALAYWFTRDERYAEQAAGLLRAWFLDPATRMNSHLNFGQAIPGRCQGRGVGIIDTTGLIDLVDRVLLLCPSPHWTDADHEGLQAWFDVYIEWLLGSEIGQDEGRARNNHGTWYDAQVAAFALFVGHQNVAAEVLACVGEARLASQIEPDGSQPHELARTKSWSYSVYNLNAFLVLGRLGEHVGLNLWHYRTVDGRSLQTATDFLCSHVDESVPWLHPQLGGWHPEALLGSLLMAAHGLNEPRYLATARGLPVDPARDLDWLLRFPLGN
ncbi:MAG: alginate lyase family protein [Victivallales bacterium]|nr:alginate lyase family protein [Victivallales bacterium]